MKFSPPIPSCSNENFCFQVGDYSFGFNGKDKESEFNSGAYDFGARIHDARLGRWMSVDPFFMEFPSKSYYNYTANNPILLIDPDGGKERPYKKGQSKPITQQPNTETPLFFEDGTVNMNAYNCHSFAWHNSKGDPSDPGNSKLVENGIEKWDNNPADDIINSNARQLDNDVWNVVGDIVIYYLDANGNGAYDYGEIIDHSAVVFKVDEYGNTVEVKGKMGQAGISVNHPNAPDYYENHLEEKEDGTIVDSGISLSRAYFAKKPNVQKLGNIQFDSNRAVQILDGTGNLLYLQVQDINTGLGYGVLRNEDGTYRFYDNNEK